MRLSPPLVAGALALLVFPAFTQPVATVKRETVGNRTTENVPSIDPALIEQLNRYQNTRGASVEGWTNDGCLLISTRFAETAQVHRACQPLGMREQLTFYPEPISGVTASPAKAWRKGFVFAKDKGGDEFSQLYWFDEATRSTTLLTDGKRSQNGGTTLTRDGGLMAYSSTARNGADRDIWIRNTRTGESRLLLKEGGSWTPMDFSPDGKELLVMKYVSAAESYPGAVNVETGKLEMFPVDGGKASFGRFAFAPDGKGVYFISDEPLDGQAQEFKSLRYHDIHTNQLRRVGPVIDWDVQGFDISQDGSRLAYTSNEDGITHLRVLALPSMQEVALPELPIGVISGASFSPDGKRLAVTLNSATSPSDIYVIDLAAQQSTRWTRSEVGGLDASTFVAPSLIRYPTFDEVDGKPRTIPAFYYKPAKASGKLPVIINIHGGPEGQSYPSFNPTAQFLANEMGVAMLVPNVRGSSGYGKTYLSLDNAEKREDSVRDIGALLDWIAQQPELDASRVGVMGGSYGGYMVLASLQHYPEKIRAGIDVVGISDFVTFLTNTESYRRDLRRAEYGDERDPAMRAVFDKISPLKNAYKIQSALFVAQGKNDPRVPWTEAEQIAKAARDNGGPVWYLLFDDEGHGFRKKANSDYFNAASMQFWKTYLLDK
ncbi:S9 family peptidase [Solilutibacter tolerans]|uniref:Dipeptidyl aminopeptidase/acylaminoacyl peptidase n=1 Tax=Solilutibacter tolerans TaxID=1604334 RepID=A0A1N6QTS2_9GAMM|nr:S9 family peptidase [Lysobacter tolerans]SIQ19983.1 Dipeptidyl aminopeptidase/acylaminoacyl peptidase [Lysobacter tolerans]